MRHNVLSTALSIAIVGIAGIIILPNAWGGTATLSWNANTESDLAGYKVYYGQSRAYSQSLDVGNVTSYMVSGLADGQTYYFAVTAYDTSRNESGYSNEVSKTFPDATAPLLSAITAGNVSSVGATISWVTDEPATSQVQFGPTTVYGASSPLDAALLTSHRVALVGLVPATVYHYRVSSRDAAGNSTASADAVFATPPASDTTPPVVSAVSAASITATGATITWTTDEPSDSKVDYGPTASYGSSTPLNITLVTTHSMTLSGLAASTAYHFRVASRDVAGNLGTSADFSVSTTAAIGGTSTPRLINLSSRGLVQTGNPMIGGFIIGAGTAPKQVLVRARGPSMGGAPFFMSGVLANPTVQLYSGQTVIAQNDDWQTTDPLCLSPATACGGAAQIQTMGRSPCQPNPGQTVPPSGCAQESALLITLPPGAYSAVVRGVGSSTGTGLVEVFDVSP